MLAAVAPVESGGVGDRFLAHLRGLVQVRRVGETAGDDPQALASQIAASLRRGDLDGALAAFAKLPPACAAGRARAGPPRRNANKPRSPRCRRFAKSAVARLTQSAKP